MSMSIGLAPPPPIAAIPIPLAMDEIYRLSVEQYHQMIQADILTEDDPVELLEGFLVRKMPKNPPHCRARRRLLTVLARSLPAGWLVDSQDPVTLSTSEPEPDIIVVREVPDDYAERHPGPAETALVAEVAESSLARDRGAKRRIYALSVIPVYWIINLVDQRIEVYTEPTGPAEQPEYRRQQNYGPADAVPLVIDGREVGRIPVQDVLP